MDITGILKAKDDAQQVSEKFKKRDFVLTDNSSQYPQHISFQLTQDKCNLVDSIGLGSEIKVHFNLRGREWTSPKGEIKYFNTLEAWRIETIGAGVAPSTTTAVDASAPISSMASSSQEDDLPF